MRQFMAAALCAAALGFAAEAPAQELQDALGRILQGFQGQQQDQDPRHDPRHDRRDHQGRRDDDRRPVYSDRWEAQDRLRVLDEADRRLDAEQRRIDEDRRRIQAERRRLTR